MKKAVFFDFDGVLVESIPQHIAAWQQVCPAAGFEAHEETVRLKEGSKAWQVCRAMAAFRGFRLSEEKAKELADAKNRILRNANNIHLFGEVPAIIAEVKRHNLKTAVVTGTSIKNLKAILPDKILSIFDFIVCDENTPKSKPDPGPYLMAAKYFSLPPSECIVIENAPQGIQSATTAGIYCVALQTTLSREHLIKADVIYENHSELLDNIPNLLSR